MGRFSRWEAAIGLALCALASVSPEVTYRKNIAPVFVAKCVSCHSPGGSGPFSLITYEDSRKRGEQIRQVTLLEKMPPTYAISDLGSIAIHPRLTNSEILAIQEWIRTGMAEGTGPLPTIAPLTKWPLGTPSLVVHNDTPLVVPSEGPEAIRTSLVTLPLDQERDLIAFDIRPTTIQSARQAVVAIEGPADRNAFTPLGIDSKRLVGAWSIGYNAWRLPDDVGVRIKPGEKLRVRFLYHPTGKQEDGGFEIGLYFADAPRKHRAFWKTIGSRNFEISGKPPYYTDLAASLKLDQPIRLISVLPEARRRATNFRLLARTGIEAQQTILNIPRWDTRWIGAYNFSKAPLLFQNAEIEANMQYDNSNHSDSSLTLEEAKGLPPRKSIFFGPNNTDELFWVHVQMVAAP